MMTRLAALVVFLLVLGTARFADAHAAPHSVVLLDLRERDVGVELRLPVPELEAARSAAGVSPSAARASDGGDVAARVRRGLAAATPDGMPFAVEVGAPHDEVDPVTGPVVIVPATLVPPAGRSARAFVLTDDVIGDVVPNHVAWVGVRSDFGRGVLSGEPTFVGETHFLHHSVRVDRGSGSPARGLTAVFRLGLQHIASGTDHLLFLLALLLPAPLACAAGRRRWGGATSARQSLGALLRIVTAFTLGHSLTLLVGALGWLRLPAAPVETAIAISILVSAVHAVIPLFPRREAWIAAAFGLVHGLAFAGALAELHLGGGELALALLAFNLGIEAMQLVVVATTYPWLVLLARTRAYAYVRVAAAAFAGLAALGWTAERALGLANGLGGLAERAAGHPFVLLVGLAGLALAARRGSAPIPAPR